MNEESIPGIGTRQIDAILNYLLHFEAANYQFGSWSNPEGEFPYYSFSSEVSDFTRALYENDFIIPFDWMNWKDKAEHLQSDPDALGEADITAIRKAFTTHVRADRFVEGIWQGFSRTGT